MNKFKDKYSNFLLDDVNALKIPTFSQKLNSILGGGLYSGKIIELYGHEGSGKTTFAIYQAGYQLRTNKNKNTFICIIDTEGGLCSSDYLDKLLVPSGRALVLQISDGNKVFDIIDDIIYDKNCLTIIIDSVAGLMTDEDVDNDNATLGSHARMLSKRVRRTSGLLNQDRLETSLIFINQIRSKINDFWKGENDTTTTGGKAMKYYASLRLEISRDSFLEYKEARVGFYSAIKVIKSRFSVPFSKCTIPFLYGLGFAQALEHIDSGIANGTVIKRGHYLVVSIDQKIHTFKSKMDMYFRLIGDEALNKDIISKITC